MEPRKPSFSERLTALRQALTERQAADGKVLKAVEGLEQAIAEFRKRRSLPPGRRAPAR